MDRIESKLNLFDLLKIYLYNIIHFLIIIYLYKLLVGFQAGFYIINHYKYLISLLKIIKK